MADAAVAEPRAIHVPQPEPGPDAGGDGRAGAGAASPCCAPSRTRPTRRGRYADEVHEAFRTAGFYRILQPKMFGGYEFDLPTFLKVVMEIARGHPAAAWCFTLALLPRPGGRLATSPRRCRRELFGAGRRLPRAAPRPAGRRSTPRRRRLHRHRARWSYSSGIPVCTHFIGGGRIDGGRRARRSWSNFILPTEQVTVLPRLGRRPTLGMEAPAPTRWS